MLMFSMYPYFNGIEEIPCTLFKKLGAKLQNISVGEDSTEFCTMTYEILHN